MPRRKRPPPKRYPCDSEEEEITEPLQSEEQTKCNEIQEISRALANVTGNQMHFENCIALAGKFPNSDFETNLETNKMELEKAKIKTAEILDKLDLLLPCPVQNCPTHPKIAKKRALDKNNGENSTFILPKRLPSSLN
ncbi:hypothetical protein NPIL_610371 [Nephila pilipes]|uniref:Uncharacterized protein n=1 Tax=Nephila pilipes TaxID=299642 RepID=A0A8X6T6A4_NEPPI|nr:hypothetical protein NPIL_610371 [Nephila pilipes]